MHAFDESVFFAMKRLTVQFGPNYLAALLAVPPVDALETALSRADLTGSAHSDYWSQLYSLFSIDLPPNGPAVGALRRVGEGAVADGRFWMAVDPLHITPNRDHLVALPPQQLNLSQNEAAEWVANLNKNFADDGLTFEFRHPARWYVSVEGGLGLTTTPLLNAVGRNIGEVLPGGAEARRWSRLWNEVQMVLHASTVNQERERMRRPTVNSVWAWGAGALPEVSHCRFDTCVADEPYALGLGSVAKCSLASQQEALAQADFGSNTLWVFEFDHAQSPDPVDCAMHCQRVLAMLLRGLTERKIAELQLALGERRYGLTRNGMRKFWRRRQPLRDWVTGKM